MKGTISDISLLSAWRRDPLAPPYLSPDPDKWGGARGSLLQNVTAPKCYIAEGVDETRGYTASADRFGWLRGACGASRPWRAATLLQDGWSKRSEQDISRPDRSGELISSLRIPNVKSGTPANWCLPRYSTSSTVVLAVP